MATDGCRVAQSGVGGYICRLAPVEEVDEGFAQGGFVVKIVDALIQGSQVFKGALQARGCSGNADVVPHRIPDCRPILGDKGRIFVMDLSRTDPIWNGID